MDKPASHTDRDHAIYAPSGASRWLVCTDSINASKGIEEKSSSYAEEGTECHEAAADILMGLPEETVFDKLSDDQVWIVDEYTNYVFDLIDKLHEKFDSPKIWIEERVHSNISPDYHGTGDFIAYAGRTMEITDLKAGFNPVLVRDPETGELNPQLASYGILALDHHSLWTKVDKVRLTIVQPRVYAKPQTTVATIDELLDFKANVEWTIGQIEQGLTERIAGKHCKYCPARGRCPALRDEAVSKAKIVFDSPKPPRLYEPEELEAILAEAEMIEAHLNGVRAHVQRELEKGRAFSNWKLVPKRAMSKWLNPDEVVKVIRQSGYTGEIANSKLKTPAQLKKELKKKGIEFDLTPFYIKESSGVTLTRMDDARDAVKYDPFAE